MAFGRRRAGSIGPQRWGFVALATMLLAGRGDAAAPPVALVGEIAPAFLLEDTSGSPLSLELHGKPLYINVFATWCPPCRTGAAPIVGAYDRFRDRVRFVGVDEQEPASRIAPFARTMRIRYTIAIDNGQLQASYRAQSVPTSVFIDRHGIVRALVHGPLSPALLTRYLEQIAN